MKSNTYTTPLAAPASDVKLALETAEWIDTLVGDESLDFRLRALLHVARTSLRSLASTVEALRPRRASPSKQRRRRPKAPQEQNSNIP